MMGPMTYVQHLFSGQRLPFTAAYFGSVALTLYFSMGVSHPPFPVNLVCRACRCTCRNVADRNSLVASTASQHNSHPVFCHYPARRLGMVPCQLLPNGNEQLAYGYIFWRPESRDVDDGLIWASAVYFSKKLLANNTGRNLVVGKMVFWLASRPGPINCEREAYGACMFQKAGKPRLANSSHSAEHTREGHVVCPRKYYKSGGVVDIMHDHQNVIYLSVSAFPNDGCTT